MYKLLQQRVWKNHFHSGNCKLFKLHSIQFSGLLGEIIMHNTRIYDQKLSKYMEIYEYFQENI